MLIGRCPGARNRTGTVGSMALVIVGLNFRSVGFSWVVHRIVEGDDLRVVG